MNHSKESIPMIHLFFALFSYAYAETPLSTSPDLLNATVITNIPIEKAVVYNQKAQVFRSGNVSLKKGINVFSFPDLPKDLEMKSLRAQVSKARILRLVPTIEERERYEIEEVNTLIDKLRAVQKEISILQNKKNILERENALLSNLSIPHTPTENAAFSQARNWSGNLDFLSARAQKTNTEILSLTAQLEQKYKEQKTLEKEARPYQIDDISLKKVNALIFVESKTEQQASLTIQYFVPNTTWTPVYHLDYDPQNDVAALKTAAEVQQTTGEDWKEIDLELSTSTLNTSIEAPTLQSWILAEKEEYVPKAIPDSSPPYIQRFDAPTQKTSLKEAQKGAQKLALKNRINTLQNIISEQQYPKREPAPSIPMTQTGSGYYGNVEYQGTTIIDFEAVDIEGKLKKPNGQLTMERTKAQFTPMVQMRDSFQMEDPNSSIVQQNTYYSVPEESNRDKDTSRSGGKGFYVQAGGLDYRWNAPTSVSIQSRYDPVRVPLETMTIPIETFYEATPSISSHAYLSATVKNASDKPILAGKTHIFIGNNYVGSGDIQTTGPKGKLSLALGVDENIRLKHSIIPKQHSKGLISKEDITVYNVRIDIANYKNKEISIRIFDQIPLSDQEEVDIKLLTSNIYPLPTPNRQGIIHWDLTIPAQKTEVIEFSYQIKRPKNWVLEGSYP